MTKAEYPSFWDDERERLTAEAVRVLGEDAVSEDVSHALRQVRDERKAPLSFSDLKKAMKTELRRLVRPN